MNTTPEDTTPPPEVIDLSTCHPGDILHLRNGDTEIFKGPNIKTLSYPFQSQEGSVYTQTGSYLSTGKTNSFDIIRITPGPNRPKPEATPPADTTINSVPPSASPEVTRPTYAELLARLDEKDLAIEELNQRLIERTEGLLLQLELMTREIRRLKSKASA